MFCTNLTHIAVDGLRDRAQAYTLRVVQTQADSALKRWNEAHNSYTAYRAWLIVGLLSAATPAKCAVAKAARVRSRSERKLAHMDNTTLSACHYLRCFTIWILLEGILLVKFLNWLAKRRPHNLHITLRSCLYYLWNCYNTMLSIQSLKSSYFSINLDHSRQPGYNKNPTTNSVTVFEFSDGSKQQFTLIFTKCQHTLMFMQCMLHFWQISTHSRSLATWLLYSEVIKKYLTLRSFRNAWLL